MLQASQEKRETQGMPLQSLVLKVQRVTLVSLDHLVCLVWMANLDVMANLDFLVPRECLLVALILFV